MLDAFREVLHLQGLIRGVLRRCGVPDADVPDLAQDVLIAAHRRIAAGAFRPPDPTKPLSSAVAVWLTGITRNLARSSRSSLAVHARIFVDEQSHPVDTDAIMVASPEEPLLAREQLQVIATLKLSAGQRKAVALASLGFTAPEIGATLGLSPNTVATWLRRARIAYQRADTKR